MRYCLRLGRWELILCAPHDKPGHNGVIERHDERGSRILLWLWKWTAR